MTRDALLLVESNTSGTGPIFVQTARALGLRPVLVTANPDRYRYLAENTAPEILVVSHVDEHELFERLRREFADGRRIAGITSSSEYFIATAAALARRFELPGPDPDCVRAARDKSWQREVLAANGILTPDFRVVASASAAAEAARDIGVPVVVKPLSASGSVGVRACATGDEAARHAGELLSAITGEQRRAVLVESLIDGPEFSVEMFSGAIVGFTRKYLGPAPHFVETGHDYPASLDADVERALADVVTRGTAALGLWWGPLHWELRVRGRRPYVMEVNPRLAGGFIPKLVEFAHGIDLIRETLRLVSGRQPDLTPCRSRFASIRFLLPPHAGRFEVIEGVGRAGTIAGVMDVTLYRRIGDMVTRRGDFTDRIGHVIAGGYTAASAVMAAERARDTIRIHAVAAHAH